MSSLSDSVWQFCSRHRLRLDQNLGQHFLIDEDVLEAIVATAKIEPRDHIVEIGPGIGILTNELMKRAKHVTAIELDSRLIPLLKTYVSLETKKPCLAGRQAKNQLTVIQGNALHCDLPSEPCKIVANIPYHITSPLLRHIFLESKKSPISVTLLIQREVAENICAAENASLLTIIVGLFGTPHVVMTVPSSAFLPSPKVNSAVLHIDCFSEPRADKQTIGQILRLAKLAFGQKRKMLKATLGTFLGGEERLSALGIDPKRRPQTLSIDEWIALAQSAMDS